MLTVSPGSITAVPHWPPSPTEAPALTSGSGLRTPFGTGGARDLTPGGSKQFRAHLSEQYVLPERSHKLVAELIMLLLS